MKTKSLLFLFLFSALSWAQNGTVSGIILDKEYNNEPLAFANISVKGTKYGSSTDMDGKYSISLKPGSYTLIVAFLGYETAEIPFTVKAGERKKVDYTLEASGVQLSDVVLVHTVSKESETALLQEQQKAVEIKQAIGAEEISKKGISDVAAAVAKTTGISKQEGSGGGLFVRGLGDRYNSTTMNGLPLPSNNPSKKNIDLGIFSTDIVEYIGIDKTYSYKNYGDFGGANIDIVSKNYRGSGLFEIGTGMGVNSNAIKQENFYLQDGPSAFGFSNEKYPNNPFSGYNFNTSWNKQSTTPVNGSLYLRGGDSYNIGENGKLSFFLNGSFDNGYNYKEGVARGSVSTQGVAKRDLYKKSFNYTTNTNLMGNVNYKINSNHTISFNSMMINSTTQKHEEYTGTIDIFDIAPNGGGFIRRSDFDRTTLLVNQLLGSHKLFKDRVDFNWGLSYNDMNNVVPDRMVNTFIPVDDDGDLNILMPSQNNRSENHRFFSELKDQELAGNFVLDYKIGKNKEDDTFKGKLTAGYSARYKELNFGATQFNFDINQSVDQPTIDLNNIDGYFNNTNFNNGNFSIFTFNGGIGNPIALKPQTFGGEQLISAGFGAFEYQFNKLFVIASVRGEYILQDINFDTAIKPFGKNKFEAIEVLPSLTAKYELNEKQNIKAAGSKTYTLPQFKERAPFQFEDVTTLYVGNPDLYSSSNYNVDVKWEYFFGKGELFSVGTFGKMIQNPINEVTIASATNDISYINTGEQATGYGVELELRKNIFKREDLALETETSLTSGLNVSYLNTDQDFNAQKVVKETDYNVFFTNESGRLTGASDWLINADVSFNKQFKKDNNIQSTLALTYFSDRIFAIGTNGRGDLVDSEVVSLDYVLKYNVNKHIGFGFSARNLLDPTISRTQVTENVIVDSFKKGRNFSFSMKYQF